MTESTNNQEEKRKELTDLFEKGNQQSRSPNNEEEPAELEEENDESYNVSTGAQQKAATISQIAYHNKKFYYMSALTDSGREIGGAIKLRANSEITEADLLKNKEDWLGKRVLVTALSYEIPTFHRNIVKLQRIKDEK